MNNTFQSNFDDSDDEIPPTHGSRSDAFGGTFGHNEGKEKFQSPMSKIAENAQNMQASAGASGGVGASGTLKNSEVSSIQPTPGVGDASLNSSYSGVALGAAANADLAGGGTDFNFAPVGKRQPRRIMGGVPREASSREREMKSKAIAEKKKADSAEPKKKGGLMDDSDDDDLFGAMGLGDSKPPRPSRRLGSVEPAEDAKKTATVEPSPLPDADTSLAGEMATDPAETTPKMSNANAGGAGAGGLTGLGEPTTPGFGGLPKDAPAAQTGAADPNDLDAQLGLAPAPQNTLLTSGKTQPGTRLSRRMQQQADEEKRRAQAAAAANLQRATMDSGGNTIESDQTPPLERNYTFGAPTRGD